MIDLRNIFDAPEGWINPTIPKGKIKIQIINLTPGGKIKVPVRIIRNEISGSQYMFLYLLFNQL